MAEGEDEQGSSTKVDDGLAVQDLATLDVSSLSPATPEVISRQATINIGTIGHVAHGKSTVVKAISGVQTVRFKNELERNITIKLGYEREDLQASASSRAGNFRSFGSSKPDAFTDPATKIAWKLVRHVSFVDCPGHDILMATMLNGAAVMDAALLLVAGNEPCPQPQTSEHLAAVEIMRLENIIILQNKVDLVKPDALAQHEQIKKFVAGTVADAAPIIPISAVLKYNVDAPGEDVEHLKGGVAGGSILQGVLKMGDEVEVRPGIVKKDAQGTVSCTPIYSKVVSLFAESNALQYAVPGGLIGVGTHIDPTLTRADRLVGQVLGLKAHLPGVFIEVEISFYLLRRLLGVKTSEGSKQAKVQKLQKQEILMVNIGSTATGGKVLAVKADLAKILLTQPVCTMEGEKIALSRRVDKHWRLIGWGQIRARVALPAVVPRAAPEAPRAGRRRAVRAAERGRVVRAETRAMEQS
ncbi:hypothetical protein JL722_11521 [Aureococcus anophagefferens]|nr:hypothetical protein JL722_11521 [Aureococcus anophagefferens]